MEGASASERASERVSKIRMKKHTLVLLMCFFFFLSFSCRAWLHGWVDWVGWLGYLVGLSEDVTGLIVVDAPLLCGL